MALFTEQRLRNRVKNQLTKAQVGTIWDSSQEKAKILLTESLREQRTFSAQNKTYDIFLSHSSDDAELVEGLKLEIEDIGYSVYVDWIEDPEVDRSNVTKDNALMLQSRMKKCQALIYAFSENAANSLWMQWELGYFDGIKGKVAVLPIAKTGKSDFKGSEYLGIYHYVQIDPSDKSNKDTLWIHESYNCYVHYNKWLSGAKPYKR